MLSVDEDGGETTVLANQSTHGTKSQYYLVPAAGHNIHTDNPDQLSKLILEDIFS